MTILGRLAEVRTAKARVAAANARLDTSTSTIKSWVHTQPLACLGVAGGAGWAWGQLAPSPLKMSGMLRLISMQVLPLAARMMAELRDPT